MFVTSLMDFQEADQPVQQDRGFFRRSKEKPRAERLSAFGDTPPISPREEALKMWRHAQASATACGVPCFLILSKRDLLDELPSLPAGISPASAESILRAQYLAVKPAAYATISREYQREGPSADAPAVAPAAAAVADVESKRTQSIDLLDSESGIDPLVKLMMCESFPELEFDEDAATALGDAVHVCITFFCSEESTVLSKRGTLPVAKWQSQPLTMKDHTWLHELPKPLPNPRYASEDMAIRLGKGSPNETRALFWNAITSLSEQLGGYEPPALGMLHIRPLLTCSGALLVVLRQDFAIQTNLGSFKTRNLKWRPVSQVAAKLAGVAQGAELRRYRQDKALCSYAVDVRDMLAETPSRDLLPSVWMDKIRLVAPGSIPLPTLSPGTYMAAFYTLSTSDGFSVLVSDGEITAMPPTVKISESHVSAEDWVHFCEIGEAARAGAAAPNVPNDWAAAKGWMGPDVGSEKQFSMLQKFFYGIISLRQRLELKCDAVRDELRYSQVAAASESLSTLGELNAEGVVLPDPAGKVQLIVVSKHFDATNVDSELQFPKGMRWQPFNIFEAEHFQRYIPELFSMISFGKVITQNALSIQSILNYKAFTEAGGLRGSSAPSMRGSDMRNSDESYLATTDELPAWLQEGINLCMKPTVNVIDSSAEDSLLEMWANLRWTKRVALSNVHRVAAEGSKVDSKTTKVANRRSTLLAPKQRVEAHVRSGKEISKAVETSVKQMRQKLNVLEGMLAGR